MQGFRCERASFPVKFFKRGRNRKCVRAEQRAAAGARFEERHASALDQFARAIVTLGFPPRSRRELANLLFPSPPAVNGLFPVGVAS